ncbi:MAG: class I SAM-dependent methyltransferase, partial [Elusimicrobiales bacterium]
MRSETKEIRYFFNKLALDWDKKESKKTFENIKKIISLIKINTFENVLDVGCGTGVCFPYLTRKFKNYIGIDLSDKMIEIAKTKYPCANFINGDFYKHKFKKNHFDLV